MTQARYKSSALVLSAAIPAIALFTAAGWPLSAQLNPEKENQATHTSLPATEDKEVSLKEVAGISISSDEQLLMPMSLGLDRVTKKTFGLKVSPETSPVPNDIFTGYHTGLDFETFSDEQNIDVPVVAACDGKILFKSWAKGYGGVLVQSCILADEPVTVIYGHMSLDSITATSGQTLLAGEKVGNLGKGYSQETDGRRKHLHFDIHKGSEINIRGYVPHEHELENWIDPTNYLE
jgi:murein DD-endopeptidase MepM/ murein hydrolase activator NlpD